MMILNGDDDVNGDDSDNGDFGDDSDAADERNQYIVILLTLVRFCSLGISDFRLG